MKLFYDIFDLSQGNPNISLIYLKNIPLNFWFISEILYISDSSQKYSNISLIYLRGLDTTANNKTAKLQNTEHKTAKQQKSEITKQRKTK